MLNISLNPPVNPPCDMEAYKMEEGIGSDAESAYLAMRKMCPDENYSSEFTKIWAWALSQDDEDARVIGHKLGLDLRHAYAVLDWEKQYEEAVNKHYEDSFDGYDYD